MLNPFRYFNSSPEIIRLAVMMYVRYPLSLRRSKIFCSSTVSTSATKRAVLVEPLRSVVCRRDQAAARRPAQLVELALAS